MTSSTSPSGPNPSPPFAGSSSDEPLLFGRPAAELLRQRSKSLRQITPSARTHATRCLLLASETRDDDAAVRALLAGADPDAATPLGRPLPLAAARSSADLCSFLLACGADPALPSDGLLPVEIAARAASQSPEAFLVLLRATPNPDPDALTLSAASKAAIPALRALSDAGLLRPNALSRNGDTPLMRAAAFASPPAAARSASFLLDAGADPAAANLDGLTAISLALSKCQPFHHLPHDFSAVSAIASRGGNLARTLGYPTPFAYACAAWGAESPQALLLRGHHDRELACRERQDILDSIPAATSPPRRPSI